MHARAPERELSSAEVAFLSRGPRRRTTPAQAPREGERGSAFALCWHLNIGKPKRSDSIAEEEGELYL